MVASSFRTPASLGFAFREVIPTPTVTRLFGGGAFSLVFNVNDLQGTLGEDGQPVLYRHIQYKMVDYLPIDRIDVNSEAHHGCLVARLPLALVIHKMTVLSLKDLCTIHGLPHTSRDVRESLLAKFNDHRCDPNVCEVSFAVLKPVLTICKNGIVDVESPEFVQMHKIFSVDDLRRVVDDERARSTVTGFKITSVLRVDGGVPLNSNDFLVDNLPLKLWVSRLTVAGIRSLALHHRLRLPHSWSRNRCVTALENHECDGCPPLQTVFTSMNKKSVARIAKAPWLKEEFDEEYQWQPYVSSDTAKYPPRPTTMHDITKALRAYCSDLSPSVVEEEGCMVCGQLSRKSTLVPLVPTEYDLNLLEEAGVTRAERMRATEARSDVIGPVVDRRLTRVCPMCHEALKNGRRPKMALANSLWLGEVPTCLRDLTLGERVLISRVRYNRCVVRVSSGHAKMVANVIAFEHPSAKIHKRLPVRQDEVDEVLAVVFTGVDSPTEADFRRSPVFVRRKVVQEALEWLKLNHKDYEDLEIDYDALKSYPLAGVPVGVLHNMTPEEDGNVPAAAKSVFDAELEEGTSSGPCPYTVHGLTAERYGSMTTSQRKAAALQYLKNGGDFLAIGHDTSPQSMYNNPSLYPQMFPWLFPYGYGGVGQDVHSGSLSEENHLKWLLMFHDKRFQEDAGFLIVAFNHQTIKKSSRGSFLMAKRNNFADIAELVRDINPGVFRIIGERLRNGGRFIPQTPEEQQGYRVFDQIDYVGSFVNGSMATKKFQRNEIWSLISFMNTPGWFVTLSPADNKHPLCVYLASHDIELKPDIKGYEERRHLITRNPVACARFFHYLVQLFIKHVCGWTDDGPSRGLFGKPSAFYGTVEQQGRMTLHLHFLLWIAGQIPLHIIRERIMAADSDFQRELVGYLESCAVGEFLTGSMDEVASRVPIVEEGRERGIHTILVDNSVDVPLGYSDPTLTLPESPPEDCCPEVETCHCNKCLDTRSWWERFKATTDDILYRSNVHTCFEKQDNEGDDGDTRGGVLNETDTPERADRCGQTKGKQRPHKERNRKKKRKHATAKGCINKDGVCTARFPRPLFLTTEVNLKTGQIDLKKLEAMINSIAPAITYMNRCNTDVTCLLSGTAVKATVGYITDYISKAWLKTHQIFTSMYDTFTRNDKLLDAEDAPGHAARKMILRVVNSLSAKMEIGAPMAALYLLQNPDHYTSHEYVCFYWKNYVNYVQREWSSMLSAYEAAPEGGSDEAAVEDVGIERKPRAAGSNLLEPNDDKDAYEQYVNRRRSDEERVPIEDVREYMDSLEDIDESKDAVRPAPLASLDTEGDERVVIGRSRGYFVAKSSTDDYRYRPLQLEAVSLYEWTQCSIKHPIRSPRQPRGDLRWFRFIGEHTQVNSHAVSCDPERRHSVVPNFLGPSLPRKDVGDREEYCCTMLTLFKPWRSGIDLKSADKTWEQEFDSHQFTTRERELMDNFNMRYECYDARDDFGAQFKSTADSDVEEDEDELDDDAFLVDEGALEEDEDDLAVSLGPAALYMQAINSSTLNALKAAGWKAAHTLKYSFRRMLKLPRLVLDPTMRSSTWDNIINTEKQRFWKRKLSAMKKTEPEENDRPAMGGQTKNDVFVVPSSYLTKDFIPDRPEWAVVMSSVISDFNLNEGQAKAFRIIANHACTIGPDQLLMHLGGMGGTGKSTVIRALVKFFELRGEPYRFVLMGPTGTSAALIGGSTYHSFLGLNTGASSRRTSLSALEEVKERMQGVGYILIDEMSMLCCRTICAISARCCESTGVFEKPFGGLSVILAGDFAQLPPAMGNPMYSRNVALRQSPRQSVAEQENTIGKSIWLQFTTVVILTENMRQTGDTPDEKRFQEALVRLRYHDCTDEDIALIRTRLAGTGSPSVDDPEFKYVSIITARNRDKDLYNLTNSSRFASEMGHELEHFYSIDKLSNAEPQRKTKRRRLNRRYSTVKRINKGMQAGLWTQPPCTSDQVPARLSLCRGMPVLIRYNVATDLCITRGQEANIVGWTSVRLPRYDDRKCLDVLYVELNNPPHEVKLPNLPRNVVPLTRIPHSLEAQMPTDEWVVLSRSQVPVLPNFSMTDYSSQGKTREFNVVDLTECQSFQAVYTCLSRGISLQNTLILRDFDNGKLKGKLDGSLRQEYRELDYLSTITDLRYRGLLPSGMVQPTRWATIDSYRGWKAGAGANDSRTPLFNEPLPEGYEAPLHDVNVESQTIASQRKRKAELNKDADLPAKKRKVTTAPRMASMTSWISPSGPIWDSVDHSCAFDAWTAILHWLWVSDKTWTHRVMIPLSTFMATLVDGFDAMSVDDPGIELSEVRDKLRLALRSAHPRDYVEGTGGVDIMTLSLHLLGRRVQSGPVLVDCLSCASRSCIPDLSHALLQAFNVLSSHQTSIQACVDDRLSMCVPCVECSDPARLHHPFNEFLSFQVVDLEDVLLNPRIECGTWGTYRLAGVIYFGGRHFTARVVTMDNKIYMHDGMDGPYSEYEGVLDHSFTPERLLRCGGRKASIAVYARSSVRRFAGRRPTRGSP